MRKDIVAFVLCLLIVGVTTYASYEEFNLSFSLEDFTTTTVVGDDDNTYTLIEIEDGTVYAPPGEPSIPAMAYDVVIPYGSTDVTVEVLDAVYYDEEDVEYLLYPGQEPRSMVDPEWQWTEPGDTYNEPAFYPSQILDGYDKGFWRGHFASQATAWVMQYNPITAEVRKLSSAKLRVNYTAPATPPAAQRWEWEHVYDRWSDFLKTFVLNPEDVYDYREPVNFVDTIAYDEYEEGGYIVKVAYNQESEFYESYVPDPDDTTWPEEGTKFAYQYIIVTNNKAYHPSEETINLEVETTPLRDWKTDKGVPSIIKTVDNIKLKYPQEGNEYWDPQVAIRKFLKAAIKYWGPEYVIFIGDVDFLSGAYSPDWGKYGVVPIRVLSRFDFEKVNGTQKYPSGWGDVVSSDLYYTDFDDQPNDWDYDQDGVFGEPNEDKIGKIKPDIACGWVPASNQTEVENYVNKVLKYEKDPDRTVTNGFAYMERFLHIATDDALVPDGEPLKTPGFVPGLECTLMYESPQKPGGGPGERPTYPQPHDINDALENPGYGFIEIDTHGHPFFHYVITQGDDQTETQVWASKPGRTNDLIASMVFADTVQDLTTSCYGIAVSLSCKTNCFEYDPPDDSSVISERFLFDADGGGVAYLGDTRDGSWSATALITQEFYRVLFQKTESVEDDWPFLGPAETWGRARAFAKKFTGHYHLYQHILCGDPELNVWTRRPKILSFDAINKWYESGVGYHVKVTVKEDNQNSYLARVCMHAQGKAYLLNLTNENGVCEFIVPEAASSIHLTATKYNCVPAYKTDLNIP